MHAKSHGLIEAKLEVAERLSPLLAQGLFGKAGRPQAVNITEPREALRLP